MDGNRALLNFRSEFYTLGMLTKRNLKLFLKDKASVFFSLLAPLIAMLLYILFLGDIQVLSVKGFFPEGMPVDEKAVRAFVDCWMLAGVLSVACVTVSLGANTIMVQDKTRGVINDVLAAPVKRRIITFSYFLYNFIVTTLIVLVVCAICFIYLAAAGSWFLSVGDAFAIIGTVIFSSLSSTLITVFMCGFFRSEGAMAGFIGIVSAVVGFLIGAYMPMNIMPKAAQYICAIFPASHSAGMFRNFFMTGALDHLGETLPPQAVDGISEAFSMNSDFFGVTIGPDIMAVYVAVFIVVFFIINIAFASRKNSIFLVAREKKIRKKK